MVPKRPYNSDLVATDIFFSRLAGIWKDEYLKSISDIQVRVKRVLKKIPEEAFQGAFQAM